MSDKATFATEVVFCEECRDRLRFVLPSMTLAGRMFVGEVHEHRWADDILRQLRTCSPPCHPVRLMILAEGSSPAETWELSCGGWLSDVSRAGVA